MSASLTIGQLARRCAISRSAVLYYEKLGLLVPSARSAAGYRRYSECDALRAQQICAYRATGMGLDAIASLLRDGDPTSLITRRLSAIDTEIGRLREQQDVLLRLLSNGVALPAAAAALDKASWVALLRGAGVDDAAMDRWHALFERQAPDAHQHFLRSLGLDSLEVGRIRSWARRISV